MNKTKKNILTVVFALLTAMLTAVSFNYAFSTSVGVKLFAGTANEYSLPTDVAVDGECLMSCGDGTTQWRPATAGTVCE